MGKIKKILENELIGGTAATDVYPVTSTKAVYDEDNIRLDKYLDGFVFRGRAVPHEVPDALETDSVYIATDQGTYVNMGGLEINQGVTLIFYKASEGEWLARELLRVEQEIGNSKAAVISQAAVNQAFLQGRLFKGRAYPELDPGTPKGEIFYIATMPGNYEHFGITIGAKGLYYIVNHGDTWDYGIITIPYIFNMDAIFPRSDGQPYNLQTAIEKIPSPYRGMVMCYRDYRSYIRIYKFIGDGEVNATQFWVPIENSFDDKNIPDLETVSGYINSNGTIGASSNLVRNRYKILLENVKYIEISAFQLNQTASSDIGLAFNTTSGTIAGVRYIDILGRGESIVPKTIRVPVPDGATSLQFTYLSESFLQQLGYSESPISIKLISKEDSLSGDIDMSNYPRLLGYMDTTTGEKGESTGNQTFHSIQPTYGKKFVNMTLPIFTSSFNRGICFYDSNKKFIGGIPASSIFINDQQRGALYVQIPIPHNATYFLPTFWEYEYAARNNVTEPIAKCILTDKPEKTLPIMAGFKNELIDIAEWDGDTKTSLTSWDYNKLISEWDALQVANTEVMSEKSIIGYASMEGGTGIASQDTSRPIYEYVISPYPRNLFPYEEYDSATPQNKVKILISTGVHGNEKSASTGVLLFVKRLLSGDKAMAPLAQNCEFHIIPCVNPWGYDNVQRNNARNVNVNRNFGYNWEHQAGGNISEKGISAYSEQETIAIRDWMEDNKDMDIFIDVHDSAVGSSPQEALFTYTYSPFMQHVWWSYLRMISPIAVAKYPSTLTNKQLIGYPGFVMTSGTIVESYFKHGCKFSMAVEDNRALGGTQNDKPQIELACNQLANVLNLLIACTPKEMKW